ncbi:MAG: 2-C-methyl-D-erythritol 2,4-cyclodiphosphate synthase [Deltaproteobacteria bacterium]
MKKLAVILVAAGRGTRAGGDVAKQWQQIAGRSIAAHTLALFAHLGRSVLVVHEDDVARVQDWPVTVVVGGDTRAKSVRAGLEALANDPPDLVLIHDIARATCPPQVIADVIAALATHTAAAPGVPVSDALWSGPDFVASLQPREGLFRAQTPQGFHYAEILAAHRKGFAENAADDVAVALLAGIPVKIVSGDADNLKITTAGDFARAARPLERRDMRIGSGYDVHRFGPGDFVTLGGVKIPFDKGVEAHSDGDVVLHALSDAIYGALAEGDIGQHFPPSEAAWKGFDSRIFLAHAAARAALRGYTIANLDVTILAEAPKVGPHRLAMQENVALTLGIDVGQVGIKATTTEKLGPFGRQEGLAAEATVLLVRT